MKLQISWKQCLPHLIILLVFIAASAIYFYPALEGKIIYGGDNISGTAACHEGHEWKIDHPEGSWWCGSMFSGMPNFQIGGHGDYLVDHILHPIRWFLSWGNRNVFFVFLFYLCAFFLLFRASRVDKWISMAGAFAMAMSSYFFVIIAATHNAKCYSITWMTLVIAGFMLTYRRQYGWGALIIAFFTYIGFFLHPQMSYYICMLIGVLFFAELALATREKEWKHFAIATAVFAASFGIGMGMGSANVIANQRYAAETMRGGHSDLERAQDKDVKTAGLDLDYATAWSYGRGETMTLLIPNWQGGASGFDLGKNSQLEQDLKKMGVPGGQARQFCQNAPVYWGEKAFTSGPVYAGAIVCFLFLLGLLIVPGPYKWALLVATLFSVFLSWGSHWIGLTELFFHYFPMYNKFRAVESILVVAEITMPLLGFMAVQHIVSGSRNAWNLPLRTAMLTAAGVTGGICLLAALFAGNIDVTSSFDGYWKSQLDPQIYQAILDQRQAMISADAWRSLLFIVLALVVLMIYDRKRDMKNATLYLGVALTALVIADMWPVDKRFCNNDQFVSVKERDKSYRMQPYEQYLLESDPSYYRVLNLTTNTYNDARTSYYLKSIGGYNAAKLRRYQDLIEEHISKMHMPVISMLNGKYIISADQSGQPFPYYNDEAMGNAWLVDELVAVDNANDESNALMQLDLRTQAVYDRTFAANEKIGQMPAGGVLMAFPEEKIELVGSYAPNRLCYHSEAERPHTAVFSEIYYADGWKCTIDGEPTDIFRVNYMLRAITLPAGQHEIVFTFYPDSVRQGNYLAMCCFVLFLLLLIGKIVMEIRKRR